MCKAAGITNIYTNHCTRVTTSVILNEAGFGENDIVHVTGHKSTNSLSHYLNKASCVKKRKMADTISNVFNAGPSSISNINSPTSATPSSFLHPKIEHPMESATDVNSHDNPDIITFDLENCDEVPESEFNLYSDLEQNKENNDVLSDSDITNYMQLFEKNITQGGMFHGPCTLYKPVFNITIQK